MRVAEGAHQMLECFGGSGSIVALQTFTTSEQPNVLRDNDGQSAVRQNIHRGKPVSTDEFSSGWVNSVVRRCFDRLIAAIVLIVLLPMQKVTFCTCLFVRTKSTMDMTYAINMAIQSF